MKICDVRERLKNALLVNPRLEAQVKQAERLKAERGIEYVI